MSGDFVPLLKKPASDTAPSFRVKVVPGAGPAEPFLPCPRPEPPLLPNASAHAPGDAAAANGHTAAHSEPKVTLDREGDRIVGIRIECPCGRVTELTCVY